MAEAVLFTLTNDILKLAGSNILSKIQLVRGASDDLSHLTYTVKTIQTVLLDAEKRQWHSEQVKLWLVWLKDVLYDAQDLLDDVATEDLRRKVTSDNKMSKAVCFFFPKSNQLAQPYKVAKRIKEIRKKLDWIAKDKEFRLEEHPSEKSMAIVRGKKPEYLSPDGEIIGRKVDKENIKQLLFDSSSSSFSSSSSSQSVSFVAIVGIGGVGKSALARLVYNDAEVKERFELKMWVCVSDVFDVNLIIKEILKSANYPDLENKLADNLPSLLHETLDRKKYLLVLDDLWNEDRLEWLKLGEWLKGGLQGSKILITTRSRKVATVTDVRSNILDLDCLSERDSWDIFRKMAFGDGVESLDPELEEMGQHIVKKCTGNPLAIRTIGGLLYGKNKDEWLRYKVGELPNIHDAVNGGIMQVLKFSYDHLPSCLKHCFAYCSLFPKDYVYEKDMMIHLWVAQGFIESRNGEHNLEEVADNYFSQLLCRSFLEVVGPTIKYGDVYEVKQFKVHDLMHDLAQMVAGGECKTIDSKEGDNDRGIRHVSYISNTFSEEKMMSLFKTSKLRTFLLEIECYAHNSVSSVLNYNKVFSSCGHCRALYWRYVNIPLPPSSLGKLKQLRFLHISRNKSIRSLPNSITDLVNLQTLKFSECDLQKFPRDLRKLVYLRHLLIECCYSLSHLPPLSELPYLRTLSLKLLTGLRFVQQTSDSEPSNTTSPFFQSLERLELSRCYRLKGWCARRQEVGAHQKHQLDNSRSSFPKLRSVDIGKCPHLNSVPSFPQVEYLSIEKPKMLEQQLMANPNCPSEGTVEATFIPFSELKYLWLGKPDINPKSFTFMLKTLLQSASKLEYMYIRDFDLGSLSREMQLPSSLKELNISNCQALDLSCQEDKHVTQWQCLTNLHTLTFSNCEDLVALPEGIQHVITLQTLYIFSCYELKRLPKWIGNFCLLEKLVLVYCPKLEHIEFAIRDFPRLKKLTINCCPALDGGCLAGVDDAIIHALAPLVASKYDSSDSD